MPDPDLRAADADRAAVATTLGEAMTAGRLTVAEYDERLARCYAARTYRELAELTTDLPGAPRPAAAPPIPAPGTPEAWRAARETARRGRPGCGGPWGWHGRNRWASWASTAVIVLGIWLATSIAAGTLLPFWPVWVIVPWGAALLARTIAGGPDRRPRIPQ